MGQPRQLGHHADRPVASHSDLHEGQHNPYAPHATPAAYELQCGRTLYLQAWLILRGPWKLVKNQAVVSHRQACLVWRQA